MKYAYRDVHVLCNHMEIKYMASRTLHFLVISLVCPAKLQNQSWLALHKSLPQHSTVLINDSISHGFMRAFFLTSCHDAIENI
jgi:hypothetical protein